MHSNSSLHQFIRIHNAGCGCNDSQDVPLKCGDRFCDFCHKKRIFETRRRLDWLVKNVQCVDHEEIRHLTLTVPSMDNLTEQVNLLLKGFRKLRQTNYWKSNVEGGLFVIEVKKGVSGWHAHIHALVQCGYMLVKTLRLMWYNRTGGHQISMKRMPLNKISYLTQYYLAKGSEIDDSQEANNALKGKRLFQPFGTWYSISASFPKSEYVPCCAICGVKASWFSVRFNPRYEDEFIHLPLPPPTPIALQSHEVRQQHVDFHAIHGHWPDEAPF